MIITITTVIISDNDNTNVNTNHHNKQHCRNKKLLVLVQYAAAGTRDVNLWAYGFLGGGVAMTVPNTVTTAMKCEIQDCSYQEQPRAADWHPKYQLIW